MTVRFMVAGVVVFASLQSFASCALIDALGGLPEKTPLDARVTGRVEYDWIDLVHSFDRNM